MLQMRRRKQCRKWEGISAEHHVASRKSHIANGKRSASSLKDLSQVSPDAEQVVLIDDKPHFALNGYVIGVPEYTQDVPIAHLKERMKMDIPSRAEDIETVFAADSCNHPPNSLDFSRDDALFNACRVLDQIFPSEQPTIRGTELPSYGEWQHAEPRPVCVEA